jgi:predicted CDP-diglyceride synthetase/phosphatidate cytidylyltransferase
MPEKDPTHYALLTYAWVVALSLLGGVVSFARKVREGVSRRFNVSEFIGELVTSAFAGLITFWLCEWAVVHPLLTAALVGISGHMGSRAIFKLEQFAERIADKR